MRAASSPRRSRGAGARVRARAWTRSTGSGPRGRIVKADIELAARDAMRQPEPVETAPPEPTASRSNTRGGAAPARAGRAARRARAAANVRPHKCSRSTSQGPTTSCRTTRCGASSPSGSRCRSSTIPHFYLAIDCELDALLAARALNALAPQEGPRAFKLSVNDFIIKAMAMALQTVPAANASWTEQGILRHRASDIAVAVALEGGGLHTPVIRDAEIKSLSEISNEMRDLAARARSKRLAPHEYQGGSTTISNLGMYGIDRFDAVINPPQASILAVGRGEKRPIVKDDALKIATVMSVTLVGRSPRHRRRARRRAARRLQGLSSKTP